MMSGRIGAIVGSNYTGALIEGNCDVIFILNASILLGRNLFLMFYKDKHNRLLVFSWQWIVLLSRTSNGSGQE